MRDCFRSRKRLGPDERRRGPNQGRETVKKVDKKVDMEASDFL
jgi:hypothetical protein